MSGTARRIGGVLCWLLISAACSSPSAPSRTTTPMPPASTSARGTISLVGAAPAAGSDILVDLTKPDQTVVAATFNVTFDTAVTGAAIELQVLDGASQVCGAGSSDLQPLAAGQAATFVVAVTTLSCVLPVTVESLKATLVDRDGAARREYLTATFAAHYLAQPLTTGPLTLTGTVVEPARGPLAGARIDVEDGVNLGRHTVTDGAGRYVLSDLVPGTFMVRASKDDYDNSHLRVTIGPGNAAQDFSLVRPPPPPPGAITFVGSNPSPGGETTLSQVLDSLYLQDLRLDLVIRSGVSLPDAKLELGLYSEAGQQCAFGYTDQPIAANQAVSITVTPFWSWQTAACGTFPVTTASLKVTLLTLHGPEQNGRLQRTDYATQTFPVRYTVRRYPPAPGGRPAAPMIESFRWHVELPVGGDPPIPGDPVSMTCVGREADGAPLTVTMRVTWDGLPTQTFSQTFPEGAASSPSGAYYRITQSAPGSNAKLECVVANGRGESVKQSAEIGYPR